MDLWRSLIRPLMFRVDAEYAHDLGMAFLAAGFGGVERITDGRLHQNLFGIEFQNPLGLAAGFDKHAYVADYWHQHGFGFAELGTVTYHPQPGNPKPRLFRLPDDRAILNRFGFNNHGAKVFSERLKLSHPQIPIGINLGKSKITPLETAPEDYAKSYALLHQQGDYFVVNVSSPNTPGLRGLQEKGPLLDILTAIREVDASPPLFVKIAPDLNDHELEDVIHVVESTDLTGVIATNTTLQRHMLRRDPHEAGGVSGAPVRDLSDMVISKLVNGLSEKRVVIGVGGIFDASDLIRKIQLGAHLVQIYTGWIYGGPETVPCILRETLEFMDREGIRNLDELRKTI